MESQSPTGFINFMAWILDIAVKFVEIKFIKDLKLFNAILRFEGILKENFFFAFKEWRHSHGMRCLGIPNTAHFTNITKINDAIE